MEIFKTVVALTALWSGFMLFICWTFLEWAKDQEERPIELKEEWIIKTEE